MAEKLELAVVAALLRSDDNTVCNLFETGRLHGVREGGNWTTTRELLEGDLELLTESARIDRLRSGIVPMPAGADCPHAWLTLEWVDTAIARVRGG